MDALSFDELTRLLTNAAPRRGVLGGLAALGLVSVYRPHLASAKPGTEKRRKKPIFNAFGCVSVDGKCRGKDTNCCSGICQGKKPKKGERDKSKCVAHNTGGCTVAEQSCGAMPPVPCGAAGFCFVTTGNASFCGAPAGAECAACRRDADCQAGFGAGAACMVCANGSCPETGNRFCVAAGA